MQRRDFFKFSGFLGLAGAINASGVEFNSKAISVNKDRFFNLNLKHRLKEKASINRLWVPLITSNEYQQLTSNYAVSTNAKEHFVSDLKIPTLYAEFGKDEQDPWLDINFSIKTTERNTDFSKVNFNENEKLTPEISYYLKPTAQIPNTGIVKQKAEQIVGSIKGDLERAKAIYTWVATNMQRDNSVIGCGRGDVQAILESGKLFGKCTDINSVFVGLCRAVNIPARELFGIRVGQSRFSNEMGKADKDGLASISGGQHCRAEFYLKGYGWIPVDPADVAKVRLGEKLSFSDTKLINVMDYLFGNWEMCWVGFNYGRDFVLKPSPEQYPINNFGYPYAEFDGNVADYYSPKDFSYTYSSQELKI